jgi:putative phosphoesterase
VIPTHLVGIISDTHGLIRPEAVQALRGSELIIHAGDIGRPEVLATLGSIAPVVAVRGNVDKGEWAAELLQTETIQVGEQWLYILHDLNELDLDPAEAGFRVMISGHSHRPSVTERAGVLFLNPGSAGPRRFKLPVCLAMLRINAGEVTAELVELKV